MSTENPLRIFIVDDETVIVETLAVILERSGFRVDAFTSPLKALSCVISTKPDLLISDVVMPHLSGIELAIQVKHLRPSCKVLLFSGQAATSDLLKEAHLKGHKFEILAKPIHPTDLIKRIREQSKLQVTSPKHISNRDTNDEVSAMSVPSKYLGLAKLKDQTNDYVGPA